MESFEKRQRERRKQQQKKEKEARKVQGQPSEGPTIDDYFADPVHPSPTNDPEAASEDGAAPGSPEGAGR